jgi:hypothetical protein
MKDFIRRLALGGVHIYGMYLIYGRIGSKA